MNPNSSATEPSADASAVHAIRAGDRERYRELVERHGDKVFAIAWCRLGDRDLAEEAAQEAFISGYRRLGLLGQTEKFGAWIGAIARNAAINLGLRRRGELRKRARWALEQDPAPDTAVAPSDHGATAPETLRESLQELPPIHRECLVLFYLENRSIAEAAEALGISENAFKVRLHRARVVLREALEARLESGLDHLRAPSRLSHAVMIGLPASPQLLALGGIASGIVKALPFGLVLIALQVASVIPGLLLARWLGKKELANFRDPAGFRSQLYRRWLRGMLIAVGILLVGVHLATAGLGLRLYSTVFGAFFTLAGLDMIRRLRVIRHPLHWAGSVGILVLAIPLLGMGLWDWSSGFLFLGQGAFFLLMSFATPRAAPSMDYSLFTRAAHGLFPASEPDSPPPPSDPSNPAATLAFARFLGHRLLIEDWWPTRTGLELRLARVVPHVLASAIPFYWGPTSRLILQTDGRIQARLGAVDRCELDRNPSEALPPTPVLEARVVHALESSRAAFLSQDTEAATRQLGEQPSDSIFHQAPATSASMRWRVSILRVAAVLMPVAGLLTLWSQGSWNSSQASRFIEAQALQFEPIAITEADVRTFLSQLAPDHTHHRAALAWWEQGLAAGSCLPPADLFPTHALLSVKAALLERFASSTPSNTPPQIQLGWALGASPFLKAAACGFLTPEDLRPHRLDPASVRAALPQLDSDLRRHLFGLQEISVQGHPCTVLTTDDLALRIRFLARSECLDLVDLSPVVPALVACQILSTNFGPNRCQTAPPETVHGLFQSRFGEFFRDTHDILFLLEAAHALDRIDREACIAGILRLHHGRGLFIPAGLPATNVFNLVRGDAPNTWFAFESLRILKALDRVPDLARWQFRASPGDFARWTQDTNSVSVLVWPSLEAWCLKRAFEARTEPR